MTSSASLIERITTFNAGRDLQRLARKYKAMQQNALGFFRGTCHLFYEDWPGSTRLDAAPAVWVCGDLHIENFGSYRGDNRLVYFDIADFDESLLAPCTWDLTRLITSALIAAKEHGLKHKHALELCEEFLDAYALALRDGKPRWIERSTAQGLIGSLLHGLERRTQLAFVRQRTERRLGQLKLRIDGKHTLPMEDGSRKRVKRAIREFAKDRHGAALFKVVDVARRIAGTGSLGLERYTILVRGRRALAGHFLLDLKFAPPSALSGRVKHRQPRWKNEAERVVMIERRMQAISPALLHSLSIGSRAYVLRELMPTQDKLDLQGWRGEREQLIPLARDLGFLIAWGELRSGGRDGSADIDELIDFAKRDSWRKEVLDYAEEYRETTWRDWKKFREAYRDKTLRTR